MPHCTNIPNPTTPITSSKGIEAHFKNDKNKCFEIKHINYELASDKELCLLNKYGKTFCPFAKEEDDNDLNFGYNCVYITKVKNAKDKKEDKVLSLCFYEFHDDPDDTTPEDIVDIHYLCKCVSDTPQLYQLESTCEQAGGKNDDYSVSCGIKYMAVFLIYWVIFKAKERKKKYVRLEPNLKLKQNSYEQWLNLVKYYEKLGFVWADDNIHMIFTIPDNIVFPSDKYVFQTSNHKGGSKAKHLKYNNREYVVRLTAENNKFIMSQGKKVMLSSIRGQYRYV